jgi:hypothetical protein
VSDGATQYGRPCTELILRAVHSVHAAAVTAALSRLLVVGL